MGEPFSILGRTVVVEPMMLRLALKNFWATNAFEPPRGVAWITPIRTQDYKVRIWSDRTDTNLLLFLGSSFEESSVSVFCLGT